MYQTLKAKRKSTYRVELKRKKKKKHHMNMTALPLSSSLPTEQTALVISASYQEPSTTEINLDRARKLLYISHLVSKFAELGWQFCLILFLTALTNYKSIVLVSSYGLFAGTLICLTGPSAGSLIDRKELKRLHIAQFFIFVQNLSVIAATMCCFFLLRMVPVPLGTDQKTFKIVSLILPDLAPPATYTAWILIVLIHIFGALGKLTDQSMTVAVERDWIVVMSKVAGEDIVSSNAKEENSTSVSNQNDNIISNSYDNIQKRDAERQNIIPTHGGANGGSGAGSSVGGAESIETYESDHSGLSIGNASLGNTKTINPDILRQLKEKTWLSTTNTTMKQIDLICRVAAPAAAGIFFGFFDNYKADNTSSAAVAANEEIELDANAAHWAKLSYAALVIGVLNIISLFVEYTFIQEIYSLVPSLGLREKINQNMLLETPNENEALIEEDQKVGCDIFKLPRSLSLYLRQPIAFGGLALSLLYLNVLSFGAIMTAYLVWKGLSYESIGILRGVSSVIGLLGTFTYYISTRKYSLSWTGSWSIIFQFSCLSICFVSLYVANDALSLTMLIIGVIASRVGLYVFDIAITQFMQELIPEDIRGVIGGVQKSLNALFDLTTYGLGFLFPDPSSFYILVATGFYSVGLAMCLYLGGVYYHRDIIQKL